MSLMQDRVGAAVRELPGRLHQGGDGVNRAHRVTDGALSSVLACGLDRAQGDGEVLRVVERVEDPEDIHPVLGGLLDEPADDAVLVMTVAEQVLPAEEHLQARLRQGLADAAAPKGPR